MGFIGGLVLLKPVRIGLLASFGKKREGSA